MLISIFYYTILVLFLTVYAVFISVVWLLTVWWDRRKVILSATASLHGVMFLKLAPGWHVRVEGRELYDRKKPYVIVCNHQGMFDIPLLYHLWPNARWVAKRELVKMPFIGHALLVNGDILIRRGDAKSARNMLIKAERELKRRVSVAVFPEGTRRKTGGIGRFREGAFVLAKSAGVEILPVVLDGAGDAFQDNWKLVRPHDFTMKVLPAVPGDTPPEVVREMMMAVKDHL